MYVYFYLLRLRNMIDGKTYLCKELWAIDFVGILWHNGCTWFRLHHLCKGIVRLFDCKSDQTLQLDDIRILTFPTQKKVMNSRRKKAYVNSKQWNPLCRPKYTNAAFI